MSEPKHEIELVHPAPVARMHPMVEAAIARGATPEIMREMLVLQREYEAGEARKMYDRALVALKSDLPASIAHDKVVDFTSKGGRTHYTHTSLAGAMSAAQPHLSAHGFAVTWYPATAGALVTVRCRLSHSGGHSEECSMTAPVDQTGSKSPQQGAMSTVTLLQRYTALSMLGIATHEHRDPTGEPSTGAIDTTRNLRAVAALRKLGIDPADVSPLPPEQWTGAELDAARVALGIARDVALGRDREMDTMPEPGSDG